MSLNTHPDLRCLPTTSHSQDFKTMCVSSDQILARRREQNRLAQRKYREKRAQQSTSTVDRSEEHMPDPGRCLDLSFRSTPRTDDFPINSDTASPYAESASDIWSVEPDSGILDDIDSYQLLNVNDLRSPFVGLDSFMLPQTEDDALWDTCVESFGSGYSLADPQSNQDQSLLPYALPETFQDIKRTTHTHCAQCAICGYHAVIHLEPQPSHDHMDRMYGMANDECRASAEPDWLNPLHIAARDGQDRIVQVLLEHQADCNEKDSQGLTPLTHAVLGGHHGIVAMLLHHGASLMNSNVEMRSALHYAVLNQREAALRLILSYSDDVTGFINAIDVSGRAPLHIAVDIRFETGVQLLLEFGADPNLPLRNQPVH